MDSCVVSNPFAKPSSIGRGENAQATQPAQPGCPVCGWSLNPMGGRWRCGRCQFSLCVGCCAADLPEEVGY